VLDTAAVRKTLPRTGGKLVTGKPFTILAMGDSVTATGDYEAMLVMLLSRATGNPHIALAAQAGHTGLTPAATPEARK